MAETKDKAPATEPKQAAKKKPRAARKPATKKVHPDDAHRGNPVRSAPPAAPKDEGLEALRKQQAEQRARAWAHNRTEVHREVATLGEKSKPIEVHAVDGRVYVNSHGEAVLDHDGAIDLQRQLAAAFQAVS